MNIRKYLFWVSEDGIKTYKFLKDGEFEILLPEGRDKFLGNNWKSFFSWFHKNAAIKDDDRIDFCFLSEAPVDYSFLKEYSKNSYSSWDKQEIIMFCNKHLEFNNYRIFYSDKDSFVCQSSNILDKNHLKTMYLSCVPEFSIKTEEVIDEGTASTSLLSRYFLDKLLELDNN